MSRLVLSLSIFAIAFAVPIVSFAALPANDAFLRTWERTERPVMDRAEARTWMWGPTARTGAITEPYIESPGGYRVVQYFEKTRMEINNPAADADALWYVTNGLLAKELITGRVQIGHLQHVNVEPSRSQIAGDRHPSSPTYLALSQFLDAEAREIGALITEQLLVDGADVWIGQETRLGDHGIVASHFVPETNHTIAEPFWDFMNSSGLIHQGGVNVSGRLFEDPFFATGFPITEAYWVHVPVGGEWQDVLLQCFERRCLTYTPANPTGWQVEAGNVGLHYHQFRYGRDPEVLDCVELNLATTFDLVQIANIGPSRAQAIMDHRPFESIADLERVPGIGPVTVGQIEEQGLACVVYDINAGANAFLSGS